MFTLCTEKETPKESKEDKSKKQDGKKLEASVLPKEKEDKKVAKEKKREKKEKKKKKKDEKEKKKLKKEAKRAKKKAAAETLDKLNKNALAAIKAIEVTGSKLHKIEETLNSTTTDTKQKQVSHVERKRKHSSSDSGTDSNDEDGSEQVRHAAKKMVLDGKNLKITKTITNDQVKDKEDEEKEKKTVRKPIENFTITTTQEVPAVVSEKVIPEAKENIGIEMHAEDEIELQEEIIEEEEIP